MKRSLIVLVSLALILFSALAHAQNPPSSSSSTAQNQSTISQGLWLAGGANIRGSINQSPLGTPGAPTVVSGGTAGSTSYTYYCVAEDMNSTGLASPAGALNTPGDTLPSSSTVFTTGNATLSASNFNIITCPGEAGALGFKVLKTNTSTYLGSCASNSNYSSGVANGTGCTVIDSGQATGSYVANTVDLTGYSTTGNKLACGGSVATAAGAVTVTAPCLSSYTLCNCTSQNNAAGACSCKVTSTATVINSATVTVGAAALANAATPSPSPVDNWWAGPQ